NSPDEPNVYIESLTITPKTIIAQNVPLSLLRSPNTEPWYFDLVSVKLGSVIGEAKGFWTISQNQLSSGGLSFQVYYKMDAFWHPAYESRSVPVATGAIYWADTPSIKLADYDTLRVMASLAKPGTTTMPSDMLAMDITITAELILATFLAAKVAGKATVSGSSAGATKPARDVVAPMEWVKEGQDLAKELWGKPEIAEYSEKLCKVARVAAESIETGGKISLNEGRKILAYLQGLIKEEMAHGIMPNVEEEEVGRILTNAVISAMKKSASTSFIQSISSKLVTAKEAIPGLIAMLVSYAKGSIPANGVTYEGRTVTQYDMEEIYRIFVESCGGGNFHEKAANKIYGALKEEEKTIDGKVSFYDVREAVANRLQISAMYYFINNKGWSVEDAKRVSDAIVTHAMTYATSRYVSENTPREITVDKTLFMTELSNEIAAGFSISGEKALDIVKNAMSKASNAGIVIQELEPPTIRFELNSQWGTMAASTALSIASGLIALGLKVGLGVAGATATFIAVAPLLVALGIPAIGNIINDVFLGPNRQGAYTSLGFAILARLKDGKRKLMVFADLPDVSTGVLKGLGFDDVIGFMKESLGKYAESMGLSGVEITTSIPLYDWKEKLAERNVETVERVGVFVSAIAWRQPPYFIGGQTITLTFEGLAFVLNFDVKGLRMKKSSLSQEELNELLSKTWLHAGGARLSPYVAGGKASFQISTATEFIPAMAVSLEFGPEWLGYYVELNVNASCWVIQHYYNVSGNLIADTKFHGRGVIHMQRVKLVALPNKDPIRIGTMIWFPDGVRDLEVPLNKFVLEPRDDGLRTYVTNNVEYFDPGNGKKIQCDERRLYYVIYNESALFLNDTSVMVKLNGTTKFATLPSVATVYIHSPAPQTVGLKVSYAIEVEESDKWVERKSGTLTERSLSVSEGVNTLSFDISKHVVDLINEVRNANRPGLLTIRADISPQIDYIPSNNWDKAQCHFFPDQYGNMTKGNATLTVLVLNMTRAPISDAVVNITGEVSMSGITNSSGCVTFPNIPSGTYAICASATGYVQTCRSALVNASTTITIVLPTQGYTMIDSGYQGNATQSPYQMSNGTIIVPLEVKVTYKDGYPVAGAKVYINDTFSGETDSWGTWVKYYRIGTTVTVRVDVTEHDWSDTRTVTLDKGVLLTFIVPMESNVSLPETGVLWVDVVYTRGLVPATYAIFYEVFSTIPQNITIEAGLLFPENKTVYVSKSGDVVFQERGIKSGVVFVDIGEEIIASLAPFVKITGFQNDTDPRNNMLIGRTYRFRPMVKLHLGILLEFKYGYFEAILYPEDTQVCAKILVFSSRDVNFVNEINSSVPVTIGLNYIMPNATPTTHTKVVTVSSLKSGNTTLYTWNFTLPRARIVNITASMPFYAELDMSGTGIETCSEIYIPPHFIVEGHTLQNPTAKVGDVVKIKVKAWSNVYSHELPTFTPFFTFGDKGVSGLEPMSFKPGTHEYAVSTVVPEIVMSSWTPFTNMNTTVFCAATPDSLPGDNFIKTSILVYNPSSWIFWLIVVIIALIAIGVIVAILKLLFGRKSEVRQMIDREMEKRRKFVKKLIIDEAGGGRFVKKTPVEEPKEEGRRFVKRKKT
ncbi:MAG: carboxypeptidase-like regulatory domain-containing protein, partial [Thermoproteota archaeon]